MGLRGSRLNSTTEVDRAIMMVLRSFKRGIVFLHKNLLHSVCLQLDIGL